jgi:hypothetical protein
MYFSLAHFKLLKVCWYRTWTLPDTVPVEGRYRFCTWYCALLAVLAGPSPRPRQRQKSHAFQVPLRYVWYGTRYCAVQEITGSYSVTGDVFQLKYRYLYCTCTSSSSKTNPATMNFPKKLVSSSLFIILSSITLFY